MTKIKITPFLIVNPIVIIWATFLFIRVLSRGGMAIMMGGVFVTIIFASSILLVADRLIVNKIKTWTIFIAEILLLLIAIKLVDWYVYG